MAGRKPKSSEPLPASGRPLRRILAVVLALIAAGGLVWGIARLGDQARQGIGPRDRYMVRFSEIECNSPPGIDRVAFLAEVRYVSGFPETFQSLAPDLAEKLGATFTMHPWVKRMEDVSVSAEGQVQVRLQFRVPELAVEAADRSIRVVDASGVLLPSDAAPAGLPRLIGSIPYPRQPAGQVWEDNDVKRALELVAAHHPKTLEKVPQGWRLTMPDGKTLAVAR